MSQNLLHLPSVATESEVLEPRRGGRPKGLPKTGGRKRGTPNKLTQDQKLRIAKAADPVGFLVKVMKGKVRDMDITPEMRVAAAVKLLERIVPPLKPAEATDATKGSHEDALTELEQLEGRPYTTAHRIAYLLAEATQADGAPNPYVRNLPSQRAATAEPEAAAADTDQPIETPEPQTEAPIEEPEPEAEPERAPPDPGPPAAASLAAGRLAWERELASQRALASRPTLEPAGPTERFRRNR